MTTALDLITAALENLGALAGAETPTAADAQRSLRSLNSMLDSWSNERGYIYTLTRETFTLTGAASYTIGTDGTPDFNTSRPISIDVSSYVQSGGVSYPLTIMTEDQYSALPVKSTAGPYPYALFYKPTYPNGTLYVYPVGLGDLYLNSWKPLATLATLQTTISLPPGYQRAIELSLAQELAPLFDLPEPRGLARLAKQARRAIKHVNAPRDSMTLPTALTYKGNGRFNIFSGQ